MNLQMDPIQIKKHVSNSDNFKKSNLSYEEILLESIDGAFSMFGDKYKEGVYLYLEETFHIRKCEIPYKITKFVNAIESTFGFGAKIIQIQIVKQLHGKVENNFKCYPKNGELELEDYLSALHQFLAR